MDSKRGSDRKVNFEYPEDPSRNIGARASKPHKRDIFEGSYSGAQPRPYIPRLRSDPDPYRPLPRSVEEYRAEEGEEARENRLRALWRKAVSTETEYPSVIVVNTTRLASSSGVNEHVSSRESAQALTKVYSDELKRWCAHSTHSDDESGSRVGFQGVTSFESFRKYADSKEEELWRVFHNELDLDGNGHLDAEELTVALNKAGIDMTPKTLSDFMAYLSRSTPSTTISFPEFRDFLLLLPRNPSTVEIYRYYEVEKFLGDDGRGIARVTMEGDVTLSAEDRPPSLSTRKPQPTSDQIELPIGHSRSEDSRLTDAHQGDNHDDHQKDRFTSFKFLLAGGIAGVVSRTCTAPFDRLKVFLITRPPDLGNTSLTMSQIPDPKQLATKGASAIVRAIRRIYIEGGILGFWVGNGLSVAKIFPESAIKFFSYETSKRFFAKYVDNVEDSRDISGVSRFISGGIGGVTTIYPVETLKTQLMSTTGEQKRSLSSAAKHLWKLGGLRAYYRGLVIGLVGVFPYAAIDMSTFEALKLAYIRSSGKEEPGVFPLLAFGSISGGVGATSVYPMNLVRTRLQASGSSGHPQRYTGIWDVVIKTYEKEGWRGFYRGLFPTLAKVIPSVSISYLAYEFSKKRLGV